MAPFVDASVAVGWVMATAREKAVLESVFVRVRLGKLDSDFSFRPPRFPNPAPDRLGKIKERRMQSRGSTSSSDIPPSSTALAMWDLVP